ncbi:tetratricopeptide repeat protein [bacterium]|nr:tetratricopeptide repeat protein [bacterium]
MTTARDGSIIASPTDRLICLAIFIACLIIYLGNGHVPYNRDVLVHAQLADHLLRDGNLELTPTETPDNFYWSFHNQGPRAQPSFDAWDSHLDQLMQQGVLRTSLYQYYVAETVHENVYVNTWGPAVSILTAPLFRAWSIWVRPLIDHPEDLWIVGKIIASISISLSAVFIYISSRLFANRWQALIIIVAYALGTSVWSTSSQNLWQHSLVELFLSAGFFLYLLDRPVISPILTSIFFSLSICCRPTGVLFLLASGVDYLLRDQRKLILFIVAGMPIGLLLMWHNTHYFGSPIKFGQTPIDHPEVIAMAGKGSVWKTPWWYGMTAHLVNPSRGILIFSPFIVFSFWGMVRVWTKIEYRNIRFIPFGVLSIFYIQATFVDWWGGFSFGYRHVVDAVPALSLLLIPIVCESSHKIWFRVVFGAMLVWSIGIQVIGVSLYDVIGWNARVGILVASAQGKIERIETDIDDLPTLLRSNDNVSLELLSIDNPSFRNRLWSWRDNQILYYLQHPSDALYQRSIWTDRSKRTRQAMLAEAHLQLGDIYRILGKNQLAAKEYQLANQPQNALADLGQCLVEQPASVAAIHERIGRLMESQDLVLLNQAGRMLVDAFPVEALGLFQQAIQIHPKRSLVSFPDVLFLPNLVVRDDASQQTENFHRMRRMLLLLCGSALAERDQDLPLAVELLEKGAMLDPGQPWAWYRRGEILYRMGRWKEAEDNLTKGIDRGLFGFFLDEAVQLRDHARQQLRLSKSEDRE